MVHGLDGQAEGRAQAMSPESMRKLAELGDAGEWMQWFRAQEEEANRVAASILAEEKAGRVATGIVGGLAHAGAPRAALPHGCPTYSSAPARGQGC
jgi:hypothetical protein